MIAVLAENIDVVDQEIFIGSSKFFSKKRRGGGALILFERVPNGMSRVS